MTNRLMTLKTLFLALAGVAAAPLAGGADAHADVTINCSVPLNVVCNVSEPAGIKSIKVTLATGLGPVDVVDQSYSCVSSATVAWDPIVPGGDIQVETCGGILPPSTGRGYAQDAITYDLRDGQIFRDEKGGSLDVRRPGIAYVLRAPIKVVQTLDASRVMQMLPVLDSIAPTGSTGATLAEANMCCDEGTMNNCFGVSLLAQCGEGLDFVHCYEDDEAQQSICESYPN
ncbi:hypothetical protein [Haliangium sp.]|uniref:hypothetical protein n=1 Tax=Haliangium sp. TaxID=2663208 RepID=UPI003D0C152F